MQEIEKKFGAELKRTKKQGNCSLFLYMATAPDYLSREVLSLLHEPDTLIYISAESVRELVVAYFQQEVVLCFIMVLVNMNGGRNPKRLRPPFI